MPMCDLPPSSCADAWPLPVCRVSQREHRIGSTPHSRPSPRLLRQAWQTLSSPPCTSGMTLVNSASFSLRVRSSNYNYAMRPRLTPAQRPLARRQQGAKHRGNARLQVARDHARIADQRRDGLHNLTTRRMRETQTVCVEALAVKTLLRTPTRAQAIREVGWGELVRHWEDKAAWS